MRRDAKLINILKGSEPLLAQKIVFLFKENPSVREAMICYQLLRFAHANLITLFVMQSILVGFSMIQRTYVCICFVVTGVLLEQQYVSYLVPTLNQRLLTH